MLRVVSLLALLAFCACGSRPARNPDGYACMHTNQDRCSEFNEQSDAVRAVGGLSKFEPVCRSIGGTWQRGGCPTTELLGTCEAAEHVTHFVYTRAPGALMEKVTCPPGVWRDRQAP